MESIFVVFLLIGLFVVPFILRSNWFRELVNQKIFFRSKHKEAKQIIAPIACRTSVSRNDIVRELNAHITLAELPLRWFKRVVYQVQSSEEGIAYAFGNKLNRQSFFAILAISKSGNMTDCIFKVTNWTENGGMIVGQNEMKKLREQVQRAFMVIESSSGVGEKSKKIHCENCGIENLASAEFCKKCGTGLLQVLQPQDVEKATVSAWFNENRVKVAIGTMLALAIGAYVFFGKSDKNNQTATIEQRSSSVTTAKSSPEKNVKNNNQKLTEQQKAEKDIPLVKILPYSTSNYSLKISLNENQETTVDALIYIYGADLRESTREETIVTKKAEVIKFLSSKGINIDDYPIFFHTNMD